MNLVGYKGLGLRDRRTSIDWFYMNLVGYKVCSPCVNAIHTRGFYMNVVGYKELIDVLPQLLNVRFI